MELYLRFWVGRELVSCPFRTPYPPLLSTLNAPAHHAFLQKYHEGFNIDEIS
jgi:hypothetical protein